MGGDQLSVWEREGGGREKGEGGERGGRGGMVKREMRYKGNSERAKVKRRISK